MIAIVTPNPDTTAETYVRQHIKLIDPSNTVVVYFSGQGLAVKTLPTLKLDYEKRKNCIPIAKSLYNSMTWGYPGIIEGANLTRVRDFFIAYGVTAVLAEFGPTGCAMMKVCKEMNIRLVVNFHGYDATVMPQRRVIKRSYRFLNRNAHSFVCGSEHFKGIVASIGIEKSRIQVVPCGIELEDFKTNRVVNDKHLIIAVGRFTEKKAPHLVIKAFSIIAARIPNARLEMIGGGELLEKCKHLITDLKLQGKVILHGEQSHSFVKEKLSEAAVFVQHSVVASNGDTESQGVSLLEAMASSLPVVVTNHNGFNETVLEGKTGFLVEEEDVKDMAEKVIMLLENDELRHSLGHQGRSRVEKYFNAKTLSKKLKKLLSNCEMADVL